MGIKYIQSRFLYFFIHKGLSTSCLADFITKIDGASHIGGRDLLVGGALAFLVEMR